MEAPCQMRQRGIRFKSDKDTFLESFKRYIKTKNNTNKILRFVNRNVS